MLTTALRSQELMRRVELPFTDYKTVVLAVIRHQHYFQKKPIIFTIIKITMKPNQSIIGKHSIVDRSGLEPLLPECKTGVFPLSPAAHVSTSVESAHGWIRTSDLLYVKQAF